MARFLDLFFTRKAVTRARAPRNKIRLAVFGDLASTITVCSACLDYITLNREIGQDEKVPQLESASSGRHLKNQE